MGTERFDDRWDVAIGAGVVVAKEPDGGSHAQVIVEEACEERVSLVMVQ
jgi:outer membrane scaffolding protein for murein synthesis (MipA/OmpV family)